MKKVNWNLEEIEKFNRLTDEELVKTSGGDDSWVYDLGWWAISAGVGIINPGVGVAVGLIPILIDASTITAC